MNNTNKRSLFAILFLLSLSMSSLTFGQTKKAFIKAAEEASAAHNHYAAMLFYGNVLEFDEDDLDYLYKYAQEGHHINAFSKSIEAYEKIIEMDSSNQYPESSYHLANMYKQVGRYDDALDQYQLFVTEYDGDDQSLVDRANREIESTKWAKEFAEVQWEEYEINHLGSGINTEFSDFGPLNHSDSLFYSSLRFVPDKGHKMDPPMSSILLSKGLSSGERLDESINSKTAHTAHTAFNKNNERLYFTLCEYLLPDSIRCDLYYREKSGDGYGEAVNIEEINMAGYTSTQPCIGYDLDDNEVLYFASNRPGGKGGLDIYKVAVTEEGFGDVINVEEVNTMDNDLSPYFHSATQTLYFSSDGQPKSLGGLDIYYYSFNPDAVQAINHLGEPLNTSYSDLYFTLNETGDTAFFSSNRQASMRLDQELDACCFDIYQVIIHPFAQLIAQTFEEATKDSLYGTQITLLNLSTGEKIVVDAGELASAKFPLARNTDYLLIGTKQGYLPDTVVFNTTDIAGIDDIVKQLYLATDVLTLDAFVFDARTREALNGATVTIYDMDDPNAEPIVITNFDANDFHAELERGKRYRVTATRKGYTSETVIIDTNDHWDKSRIQQDFYLNIGDLADFLPLVLFFDNDHPNPRTWLERTDLAYTQTYPPYYARKQTFVDRYTEPLTGVAKEEAAQKLISFFDNEVRKGNDDLLTFLEVLEAHLEEGDEVHIFLKGYASPRSSRAYNYALGKRRVSSVQNNFKEYADGAFASYLDSGQLTIKQESFGETTAPKGISSSIPDERNSIYSYEASKERRVEIIQIDIND